MPDALRLEHVTYRYPASARPALDDVTLSLPQGQMVVLAGTSGSGKSTLLRAACGLVPHFFGGEMAGRVSVCGRDTRGHGPAQLADVASLVFQDPEAQVVMNGVRAELELALEGRGHCGAAAARAMEETALALGIGELLERPVRTLSGGELQRVALATALVAGPRVLLLDEPTSQLDPVAGEELLAQLRRVNEEWGTTVLLGEHRLERCLAAADRVLVLDSGRIVCDAAPDGFLNWAAARRPDLLPPAARMFSLAGLRPLPVTVKQARASLREARLEVDGHRSPAPATAPASPRRGRFRRRAPRAALSLEDLWVEFDDGTGAGTVALRGLSLHVAAGETVALLGQNGAGKTTLLRTAAGVLRPDRGTVRASGDVALLLQAPSDYLLHERVADELPSGLAAAVLRELELEEFSGDDPHDLPGGARQRLALGIVLAGRGVGGGDPPAVIALDEPTRGMDPARKARLAARLAEFAAAGAAVVTATHDVEFAARLARRCVLLGRGRVVADGPTRQVLSGGRYFTTEVARVLGPGPEAVLAEDGAAVLSARRAPAGGVEAVTG
jgi:energy-coupling factor transport system ATP-binding protein